MKKSRQQGDLDYKRRIVAEYLAGTTSAEGLVKREGLVRGQIYKWRVQLDQRRGSRACGWRP
jgi:transposase-like protein